MGRSLPILSALILAAALATGCLRDLSGLTVDGRGRLLAVNNRPGLFALCEPAAGRLKCRSLPFRLSTWQRYDLEGVAFVDDDLFYAVSEKRDNTCLGGCSLSQEILPFRLDEKSVVSTARCASLSIPLLDADDPACAYANCGLEGVAYDPQRRLLYVAKEARQARILAVALDENHCPTGNWRELQPPVSYPTYNDLSYSPKRGGLFVLSAAAWAFYEWDLASDRVTLESSALPEVDGFLKKTRGVEGIAVDDARDKILLLAEDGSFAEFDLPPRR